MDQKNDYTIIKAGVNDIDEIIEIFRDCFPYSFKWQTPKFLLRKKLSLYLESGSVEIHIIRIKNEIACFYELVVDIPLFMETAKKEQLMMFYFSYIYVALVHPNCIIPAIKKLIKEFKYKTPKDSDNRHKKNIDVGKMAWGEYQGVSNKYRKMGLSKVMQKHILSRCVILGKEVIGCINDPDNIPVVKLHKSFGYSITGENKYGCIFQKILK
jgi:hypothetical protein